VTIAAVGSCRSSDQVLKTTALDGNRRQLRVKVNVAVAICLCLLVLSLTCTETG
jgi:hypothetical protein